MNHNRRNSWTIALLALVVMMGVACAPIKIASGSNASTENSSGTAEAVMLGSDAKALPAACPPANSTAGKDVGHDYFVKVVGHLKDVPVSDFAANALDAWKPYENTSASWNPLATTWIMEVRCDLFNNSAHVQNYQDQDMGVRATANTLNQGYYDAIRKMLRHEAFDREGMRAALGTWGTCSGQGCDSLLNKWQDGYGKN